MWPAAEPSSHLLRHPGRCMASATCPGPRNSPASGEAVAAVASADDPNVLRLGSLLALRDVELELLPFLQAAVAATGDRADVHEHVRASLDRDEAIAPVSVEPLHRALRHLDLLRSGCGARHSDGGPRLPRFPWPACHATRGEGKPRSRVPCPGDRANPPPPQSEPGWSEHPARARLFSHPRPRTAQTRRTAPPRNSIDPQPGPSTPPP